jgi:tight adherence protein B
MVVIVSGAWFLRRPLHRLLLDHPAALPASILSGAVLMLLAGGILILEGAALRRAWLQRLAQTTSLDVLRPLTIWAHAVRKLPDPLELLSRPLLRTRWGRSLAEIWRDAGYGEKASRFLVFLASASLLGALLGSRVAGPVLGVALALAAPSFPLQYIRARAESKRRRFDEQLPAALDSLAAGLSAGLSFPQAVEYAQQELPPPVSDTLERIERRIRLGRPVEEALVSLTEERPDESLALVVDGIVLQRRFGGDMIRMLKETAGLLRARNELEHEVRAVTTQGRLSGWIIAALMPISAGILLAFNPRYIDVLFNTFIGQALLVAALSLQLVGWLIISRLVRIRY